MTCAYTPLTLTELEMVLTIHPADDVFDADDVEQILVELIEDHLGSLITFA